MGCDIHFHRLYTVHPDGTKEDLDVVTDGTVFHCEGAFETWGDVPGKYSLTEVDWHRNYCAFAILADVRNNWGYTPLPSEQEIDSEEWGDIEHTPTRLRISDFVATPEYWEQESCRFMPGEFGTNIHTYATDAGWYYSDLLPAIVAECERRGFALGQTYLEFWFDS